jgi:hypothetical protein
MYIFFLALISVAVMAQENKLVWDYPVKPDMEEWKSCKSPNEIYKKLLIPDEIIKDLGTETLIELCLDYPAPTVFFIFNTPQQGFDGFFKQFNGIRELMSRKETPLLLLEKYKKMTMNDFNHLMTLEQQGKVASMFYLIELFLVQPVILQSFNNKEIKTLLQETLNKITLKNSMEVFGGYNRSSTLWLIAKVLHVNNKLTVPNSLTDKFTHSLETGQLIDIDIDNIVKQAKSYAYE